MPRLPGIATKNIGRRFVTKISFNGCRYPAFKAWDNHSRRIAMRTVIALLFASVTLAACGGSDRPVVVNQPPANVTIQQPPAVVMSPSSTTTTRSTSTTICPAGSIC
jgi:hypothetical protein